FLPREVYLPTYTKNAPRGRAIFERLYPEADWAGGLLLPLGGDLRLLGWRTGPGTLSLSVRVANDAPEVGALAIRQLRFPGWRAWATSPGAASGRCGSPLRGRLRRRRSTASGGRRTSSAAVWGAPACWSTSPRRCAPGRRRSTPRPARRWGPTGSWTCAS